MNSGKVILSLLAGVAFGALAGILFAPKKGKVTSRFLSKKGKKYTDELEETFSGIIDGITEKLESIKEETIRIANNRKIRPEEDEMDLTTTRK